MTVTLKSRIPQIQASLPIRVGVAIRETAEAIADQAAIDAPDRDPRWQGLPASIEARSGEISYGAKSRFAPLAGSLGMATPARDPGTRSTVVSDIAYGVWAAWYWRYPEFGTARGVAPRPFMIPAAERERTNLERRVAAAMRGI